MASKTRHTFAFAASALLCHLAAAQQPLAVPPTNPSPEGYIAWYGGKLAPAGNLLIDGRRMECGQAPTVLDPEYRDFGGSYPGFLVLNPQLFAGLPTVVKLWIFSHECAHQTVGPNEQQADCAAIQRGRREGWLTKQGLGQICQFMRPARADETHFHNGRERCLLMQKCFQERGTN